MYYLPGVKLERNTKYLVAKEMAQRLRTLPGLSGDQGSFPSTHMVVCHLSASMVLHSCGTKTYMQLRYSHSKNKKMNKSPFKGISVGTMHH